MITRVKLKQNAKKNERVAFSTALRKP